MNKAIIKKSLFIGIGCTVVIVITFVLFGETFKIWALLLGGAFITGATYLVLRYTEKSVEGKK